MYKLTLKQQLKYILNEIMDKEIVKYFFQKTFLIRNKKLLVMFLFLQLARLKTLSL